MQEISIIPVVCLSNFGENIGRVDHELVHSLTEHSWTIWFLEKLNPKNFVKTSTLHISFLVIQSKISIDLTFGKFRETDGVEAAPWKWFCNVLKTPRSIAKSRQINTILSGGLRFVFLSGFSSVCEQWIRLFRLFQVRYKV